MAWSPTGDPLGDGHWHGATATAAMTHIALQEQLDGGNVEWLEKVTDEEYHGKDAAGRPSSGARPAPSATADTLAVAPALERFTRAALLGDVWKRPELSPRDRSLVTVAALVARSQAAEMPYEIARALDNGVTPAEVSETVTHMAFYAGWPNAMAVATVARDVFTERGVTMAELPPASGGLLPRREVHDGAAVPRPVAPPRPGAPGSQPRDRQRAHRHRTGRAAPVPPQQGERRATGPWTSGARSRRCSARRARPRPIPATLAGRCWSACVAWCGTSSANLPPPSSTGGGRSSP